MARLALTLCLVALPALADDADAGADAPRKSYVIPAAESLSLQLSFLTFSNLVSKEPFAHVSWDTVRSHLDLSEPWNFDTDNMQVNQLGHPYMGALTFNAARSSGLSFWWGFLYTEIESLIWELCFEDVGLSINDQITTPIGGAVLGEALHRAAQSIIYDGGEPLWVRYLCAVLVDPMALFNRWLFDEDLDPYADWHARTFTAVFIGVSLGRDVRDTSTGDITVHSGVQASARLLYDYVMPGDSRPFSRFNVEGSVEPGTMPLGSIFVRGLLWGPSFARADGSLTGAFGMYGTYDFSQPALMRASSVGAGPGAQLTWQFSEHGVVKAAAELSWVPFGAVGAIGVDEDTARNFHIGPGLSAVADLRLIHTQAGMVRVFAQEWFVIGAYGPPTGYESMTYFTAELWVRLIWRLGAAVDFTGAWRAPYFNDDTFSRTSRASNIIVSLVYMSDEGFGAHVR